MIKLTILLLAIFISIVFGGDNPQYAYGAGWNGYPQNNDPSARCRLPIDAGPCYEYGNKPISEYPKRYAFDNERAKRCVGFIYGGCGGNANRFRTIEDCINTCERNNNPGPNQG